jgi:hypothetical protein
MARQIESHVPEGQTVFALDSGAMQSYTTRFILDGYHSAAAEIASELFYAQEHSASNGRFRWVAVFPKTRVRQVQIFQTGENPAMWSMTEIRFLQGGKLVPASQNWRWDAYPNPWDVGFLFDGLPVTGWRSWEPLHPGMYIRVRIDPAESIDGVEVLSGNGPWESKMDPRILDDSGHWLCPVSVQWHLDPPLDLRRDATQVLRRQGIQYVLISGSSWHGQVFRGDPGSWGMHEVLSTGNATLYHID